MPEETRTAAARTWPASFQPGAEAAPEDVVEETDDEHDCSADDEAEELRLDAVRLLEERDRPGEPLARDVELRHVGRAEVPGEDDGRERDEDGDAPDARRRVAVHLARAGRVEDAVAMGERLRHGDEHGRQRERDDEDEEGQDGAAHGGVRPPPRGRRARGRACRRRRRAARASGARARGRGPRASARAAVCGSSSVSRTARASASGSPAGTRRPRSPLAEEVGRAADARRDDRAPRRHRLDERDGRALVARGVHDDVEVAVDGAEVGAPAGEDDRVADAQLGGQPLERGPLLAVAHEGEADARVRGADEARGAEERRDVLDRHEAADHPHERRVRGDARLAAQHATRQRAREVRELEAERDDADLLRARDAEAHEVVLHRVGDGDERVRVGREPRLEAAEDGRLRRREVPAQHVAVVRVHDRRHPREARGDAAEHSRLGRVRVDDRGTPLAHDAAQAKESAHVGERGDLAAEAGERLAVDLLLAREAAHVALAARLGADDEARLVAALAEVRAQQDHVDGRTPYVEPGEDPQHAHLPPVLPRGFCHSLQRTSRPVAREGSTGLRTRQPKFRGMSEIGHVSGTARAGLRGGWQRCWRGRWRGPERRRRLSGHGSACAGPADSCGAAFACRRLRRSRWPSS